MESGTTDTDVVRSTEPTSESGTKIGGLVDWLSFIDGVVEPAERVLRDVGIAEDDWLSLSTAATETDADQLSLERHMGHGGDVGAVRSALTALCLRQQIRSVAGQVAYRPDRAAACLAALAWKLNKALSGLPSRQRARNDSTARPPTFLQTRAIVAILSGDYGVKTTDEVLALLTSGGLDLRAHDIDVWRDELTRKLIFRDMTTQEMEVVDESTLDEALIQAKECIET